MTAIHSAGFIAGLLFAGALLPAQNLPPADDSRQGMLRETMLGLTPNRPALPFESARQECVALPVAPANDRLEGPHGGSLISTRCEVLSFEAVPGSPRQWFTAQYRWTSLFSVGDPARGSVARDTVIEEEAVLLEARASGQVRPVWHWRFESDVYGVWRSVTPEIALTKLGTTLLSVMLCLNGTGGCTQEFLQRHADGKWSGVRQAWLDQLPSGYLGRIRHGFHIEPSSLRGQAGFYADNDANCCPSQRLQVEVAVMGDLLVLLRQSVIAQP